MKDKLAKLIDVKSIVTLVLQGYSSYLSVIKSPVRRTVYGHICYDYDLLL